MPKPPDLPGHRPEPVPTSLPHLATSVRIDDLLIRYWDGALSESELAELNAALRSDPAARVRLRMLSLETTVLADRFAGERSLELEPRAPGMIALAGYTAPAMCPAQRHGSRRRWVGLAVGLAATLAAALLWPLFTWVSDWANPLLPTAEPIVAVAWLGEFSGSVAIDPDGARTAGADLAEGQPIPAGATVRTQGLDASAEVVFADGTRLTLAGNTSITVGSDEPKVVHILSGNLAADVKPQPPARPMKLHTPEAHIDVLGTRFTLSAASDRTVVGVAIGSVRVTRLADGKALTVTQGSEAVAEPASELKPTRQLAAPDEVTVSFEGRLPSRWAWGQFVTDDLPPGSAGAVRALPKIDPKGRLHHSVVSHNLWTQGMVLLHPDTWMHVRLRVDRPGPLDVLMVARDPNLRHRRVSVIFAPKAGRLEPGRWHTLSFPVAEFQRAGNRLPPEFPLLAFQVVVDTLERDRGLMVERFWFTRGPRLAATEMDAQTQDDSGEGC